MHFQNISVSQRFAHFERIPMNDPHHRRIVERSCVYFWYKDALAHERPYTRNILGAHLPSNYYWNMFFIK